jgi:Htaa protein
MSPLLRRVRIARLVLPAAAIAATLAVAAPAASAAPAPASGGQLDWSTANIYVSGGARTWLGYVTTLAGGTATASAGAQGATITPESPKSETLNATFGYKVGGGRYDPVAHTGTITTSGTVTFASTQFGFAISIANPRIVLSGATGQIFASGQGGSAPYTDTQPLFDLDLSKAVFQDVGDGVYQVAGMIPSLATANTAFPPNYPVGSGPDRTPNTFGAFALNVVTGLNGTAAKARKGVVTVKLTTAAASSATRTYKVRITSRGTTVAKGTVRGATLKVKLARKGAKRLAPGAYALAGLPGGAVSLTVA